MPISAVGYLTICTSLITLSVRSGMTAPVILYALAICRFSVALATVLLLCR